MTLHKAKKREFKLIELEKPKLARNYIRLAKMGFRTVNRVQLIVIYMQVEVSSYENAYTYMRNENETL